MAFNAPYNQQYAQRKRSVSPQNTRSPVGFTGSGKPPGPGPAYRSEPMLHAPQYTNGVNERNKPTRTPSRTRADVEGRGATPSSFDSIRLECLRRGKLFEDKDFPAADQSLYYSRQPPFRFEWKRPGVCPITTFSFPVYHNFQMFFFLIIQFSLSQILYLFTKSNL